MQPANRARFAVIETVYYHSPDSEPAVHESKFNRFIESDEQPYKRRVKIGEEWTPLDTGWIIKPSLVVVTNESGTGLAVQPTVEERGAFAAMVLEIGFKGTDDAFEIPPGESFRGCPTKQLYIRCRKGDTKYTVFAV